MSNIGNNGLLILTWPLTYTYDTITELLITIQTYLRNMVFVLDIPVSYFMIGVHRKCVALFSHILNTDVWKVHIFPIDYFKDSNPNIFQIHF